MAPVMRCDHCGAELLHKAADGRLKMRVPARLIAFRKSAESDEYRGEMPCPSCRKDTRLAVKYTLSTTESLTPRRRRVQSTSGTREVQ